MPTIQELAQQMRSDWDRRIAHDHRFWMSDGYRDDRTMWESGERDFAILVDGIERPDEKVLVDLGCGVGRLVRAGAKRFRKVMGFDVSAEAIRRAQELLHDVPNAELLVGSGVDLQPLEAQSVDVVTSFAALTSMPTTVIARYLADMHRVLKMGGVARIQVYLGKEQPTNVHDTLHLRCFERAHFERAVQAAGFQVEFITELMLPFQVSFKDIGIVAYIVSLKKVAPLLIDAGAIEQLLLPRGELPEAHSGADSRQLEGWMCLHYARELSERGELQQAKSTLEYAVRVCPGTALGLEKALAEVNEKLGAASATVGALTAPSANDLTQRNLHYLQQRFPAIAASLVEFRSRAVDRKDPSVVGTPEGPVIMMRGQCLDHPNKPRTAGQIWLTRTFQDLRFRNASTLVMFGAGSGYHLEGIATSMGDRQELVVIEPSIESFSLLVQQRDLEPVLRRVNRLLVGTEIPEQLFDAETELLTRPQTQTLFPELYGEVRSYVYSKKGSTSLRPMIAVLGPLQGGTLPMAGYTSRTFRTMGQRVRDLDVSGFAGGFHLVEQFIQQPVRKAISQGTYLEAVSQVLLEGLTERPIDLLICMAQAPITGRVLTELRNRGVQTALWFVEDYRRFTYWREMAKFYDFVFTIQRGKCIDAIKAAGAGEVHYLPVACDPEVHRPLELSAEDHARWGSPISFVGAGYYNRQQVFASLADLPMKLWGTEWPTCKPFDRMVQEQGRRLTPDEYIKIFNATSINLNLHSSSERDGVDPFGDFLNPRIFELAAAGAFQLVDQREYLPEAFAPGEEIATFSSPADLKEKIHYYLQHPEERQQMAQRARARALRDHTYSHRLREMLAKIYSTHYERMKVRLDATPWARMLRRSVIDPELKQRCDVAFARGEEPNLDGLVADIVGGKGKLSETEQKLLFLFHVRKQIIFMRNEEAGVNR